MNPICNVYWSTIINCRVFNVKKFIPIISGNISYIKFISDTYSGVDIKDYNVAVNFAVTGDNGDEWVLLWDNGKVVAADGNVTGLNWMESFRFDGDKIAFINQFSKSRN